MRTLQTENMVKLNPDKDWSFIQRQIGMFSYTGLSKDQVQKCMTDKHHIYMTMVGAVACSTFSQAVTRTHDSYEQTV